MQQLSSKFAVDLHSDFGMCPQRLDSLIEIFGEICSETNRSGLLKRGRF